MIIGITGGSGCGKTTLLSLIRAHGGLVLDCDEIYHDLLKTDPALLNAIEARFPGTVEMGVLQRKKLGNLVFEDEKALADLNMIAHSAVKAEVMKRLKAADRPELVAIDAIALFEGKLSELCQLTVAVTAPTEHRIQRLIARDHITRQYAQKRIGAQKSNAEFSALCDHTLENNGSLEDFHGKCLAFLQELGIM